MSKERDLLNKTIEMIQIVPMMASIGNVPPDFGSELILEIQELLAQPESLREGLREDLREGLQEEISLRDHFAGLAMQGMADPQPKFYCDADIDSVAKLAYQQADAMMAEREKNDH